MSIAKVEEITSESPESFEMAIRTGIERACKTLRNVRSAWVNEQSVTIQNGKPSMYRVSLKVTFVLED